MPVGFRSDTVGCPEQFQSFFASKYHIHYATHFRYAIPDAGGRADPLSDCDMIFTQDLSPLFEVALKDYGLGAGR